jgi:hypothetical protein
MFPTTDNVDEHRELKVSSRLILLFLTHIYYYRYYYVIFIPMIDGYKFIFLFTFFLFRSGRVSKD